MRCRKRRSWKVVQNEVAGFRTTSNCIGYVLPRIEPRSNDTKLPKWRKMVRQEIDQTIRTRNVMKALRREYWSRVIQEEKSALKEKWENAFSGKQLDNVRKGLL